MLSLVVALVVLAPEIPPECQPPPLREAAGLTTFAQSSGSLSVGLDSVATWCFDSGGTWTAGQTPAKGKTVTPNAEPTGDCRKAVISCEAARASIGAEQKQLLYDVLSELEKPFLGVKYKPKRSGLAERPPEVAECSARDRSTLFAHAQARMDLARLASQAQNEYANYRTWLFSEGLKCAQAVARGEKDYLQKRVAIDQPTQSGGTQQVPNANGGVDAGVRVIVANAGAGNTGSANTGVGNTNGGNGTANVGGNAKTGTGSTSTNAGAGNTGNANTGNANTGNANTGNANTGNANTGNANTGNANTGNANAGNANTGNANTGNANTGNANTGNANTGNANTGNANTGLAKTGTGIANTNAGTGNTNAGTGNTNAGTGNTNTGTGNTNAGTGNANAGTGNANAGTGNANAGTGNANAGTGNTGTGNTNSSPTNLGGVTKPGGIGLGGPTAEREKALAGSMLEKWRYFMAEQSKVEGDVDWVAGFLASRELRDCRCLRPTPGEIVRRLENKDRIPQLEADDEKNTRCELCLLDVFPKWKLRTQKQCALIQELSEFEIGVLQRSDDGNGLPPRCLEAAKQKQLAKQPATITAQNTKAAGSGAYIITKTPDAVPPAAGSSDFLKPSDYAPMPAREEGRVYVRVFTSSSCTAELLPGPVLARTGDLLPVPPSAKEITVRGACGGFAEVYFGKEEKPRVAESFARNQPLRLQFKAP